MNARDNWSIVGGSKAGCVLAGCVLSATLVSRTDAGEPASDAAAVASPAAIGSAAGAPPALVKNDVAGGQISGGSGEPSYGVSASWVIAGYNDNEVIYSILITNNDANVIRCTTLLNGFYLDNGARHAVSDRQSVTLFPGKQSSAGTWVGLDQTSGATYRVTCRAVH